MIIKDTISLSIILSLTLVSLSLAQSDTGTGKGTVAQKGKPLPGLNISIQDLQKGASADAEGYYKITKAGKLRPVLEYIGSGAYHSMHFKAFKKQDRS